MTVTLPRITTRIDIETQELLSQAAVISGISSINSFVLNASIEKAKQIIKEEQSLKLSQRDATALIQALDEPSKEYKKLQKAARFYFNTNNNQ